MEIVSDIFATAIAVDISNDDNICNSNPVASAVAVPVQTPSSSLRPSRKRKRDLDRAVNRERQRLRRADKVNAAGDREVLSDHDKHAEGIAQQFQQNPVMVVRKRDAGRIQALVDQGIITGTLAESVKHISESVKVRRILQIADHIVDGSYTEPIAQARLDHIRQLAVAGKIPERTLTAVELYHVKHGAQQFIELAETFRQNPVMFVRKTDAERVQTLVNHGLITGTLAESVQHICKSVRERKALQMAVQIVNGLYSGPVSQANMDHVLKLHATGTIPALAVNAVNQYKNRNAPERKQEQSLLQKHHKSYHYSEIPLAKPCETCGCKLLRGETSALCCLNGQLLIDRAKVDNPATRPQTRIDDNPKELEALLCRKIGKYSRELNKMFSLTSIGASNKEDECLPHHLRRRLYDFDDKGAMRCNGLTYHVVFPADRENDGTPKGDMRCGLTYYVYDKEFHDISSKFVALSKNSNFGDLLDAFRKYMKSHNPHVKGLEPIFETNANGDPNPLRNAAELKSRSSLMSPRAS